MTTLLKYVMTAMLFVCFMTPTVFASGWSNVASTCIPDDNNLINPNGQLTVKHFFDGPVFQFRPLSLSAHDQLGLTLPITVRCPVLNPYEVVSPYWGQLIVTYEDPDGPGKDSRVVARLVKVFRPSGSMNIAVFDSDAYPTTGPVMADRSVAFSGGMDFANADYFVVIQLYRKTLFHQPRILRVRLDE